MPSDDTDPNSVNTPANASSESVLPKRRDRLEALLARREGLAVEQSAAPAAAPVQAPAGGAWTGRAGGGAGMRFGGGGGGQQGLMQRRGGMGGGMGQGGGMRRMQGAGMQGGGMQAGGMQGGGMQRKIAARLMRVLMQTPADHRGYVPDTPFTQTGVGELMRMLNERASVEGAPGARAAGGVLRFLTASADGGEKIEGASLQKLQGLARLIRGGGNLQGL